MSEEQRPPRVLICDPIHPDGVEKLKTMAEVDIWDQHAQPDLRQIVNLYEAVILRSATQITADVLEHALNLKVIGRAGSGLENIDVVKARDMGIEVVNSPGANALAVAEHTMGLLLAVARQLPLADRSLKGGQWEKKRLMGVGLAGKTLGIIGFGRIGREVCVRAQAFGMHILTNQKRPTPELNIEAGIENVSLDALLTQSDFVTLHVPLREDTRDLIGTEELRLMKPSAYLINTARGGVVNEEALVAALNAGQLAGAGVDVFVEEPATNSTLAQHPRVLATPHIAASTADAQRAATMTIVDQIVELLEDVALESVLPLRVVPLEKIMPHESIDPKRVARLAERLEDEGHLINPPVVTELEDKYMILDGATRTAAFKKLGYPHLVVQVVSPEEGLGLRTWFHAIQQLSVAELIHLLERLPDVSLVETRPERADDEMFEYGGLCYVHTIDGRVFMVQPAAGKNRLEALNRLTETYIAAAHVDRTLDKDLIRLQHEYPGITALIVFPEYTVSQVMQVTLSGRYFPAGITRFLIPGRILRLFVDLEPLKSGRLSLRDKNKWLNQFLEEKVHKNAIRYYHEPVYLLDE